MIVLDTNVIIRHLTRDNADHQARADAFFNRLAAGNITVRLPEAVVVESVQVLESKMLYGAPRDTIRSWLAELIRLHDMVIPNKHLYVRALDVYVDYPRLSFVDALCVAYAERESEPTVLTFDRGFDRVPGLVREEP
jgi:predicted nucleic acid-binding protein